MFETILAAVADPRAPVQVAATKAAEASVGTSCRRSAAVKREGSAATRAARPAVPAATSGAMIGRWLSRVISLGRGPAGPLASKPRRKPPFAS